MARKGMQEVRGVDVREANLEKARLVAEVFGLRNLVYQQKNCEDLRVEETGQYELCLFLGLLYHLENPMLCLRNISRITSEVCIIETQVVDEVEGVAEWGGRAWTRPYHGVLALIDEAGEFYNDIGETGASPLATCPSPNALHFMLQHAGFRRSEIIQPPPTPTSSIAAANAWCAWRIKSENVMAPAGIVSIPEVSNEVVRNADSYRDAFLHRRSIQARGDRGFLRACFRGKASGRLSQLRSPTGYQRIGDDLAGKPSIRTSAKSAPFIRNSMRRSAAKPFLELVSRISGIPDLILDPKMYGGGTHDNQHGQELDPHVDFNYDEAQQLHRRLNLIVYMNKEWSQRMGRCA